MAYLLENNGVNAYVGFGSYTIGGTIGDYFEYEGNALSGNAGGIYRLVGDTGGYGNLIEIQPSAVVLRVEGQALSFTTGYTQPAVGTDFAFRVERTAASEWQAFIDGVSIGTATSAKNLTFNQILRFSTSTVECFLSQTYKCTVRVGATTRVYDSNLSGGTGSTLPTNDGVNQGTLNNFPTDDSQWVVDGPNITVTPADLPLTPGGTISGTYADYTTVPTTLTVSDGTNTITIASPTITDNGDGTGSFSGTMPALPTTGTANLVLFGDVTVELS